MSKINWSDELEAVNRDTNEVHALDPMRPNENRFWPFAAYSQSRGDDFYLNPEHEKVNSGNSTGNWYIRNRQSTPSTDRLARLEAFVARVSEDGLLAVGFQEEAKALVAELNPVDPLLIKARRIALDEWQPSAWDDKEWEKRVMAGDEDEDRAVRSAYSALRQARKEGNDNAK